MKTVAVIGSGGREHALGWKLKQSPQVGTVIGISGNPGWKDIGPTWALDVKDHKNLAKELKNATVDLVVIGPEGPLVDGLADYLRTEGFLVFGPGQRGAELEASKVFSKKFMQQHQIPTAAFAVFTNSTAACNYIDTHTEPLVVKASGLAAGKGVVVAKTRQEAKEAVWQMLDEKRFGAAGHEVVIEECLVGEECSIFALTDGNHLCILQPCQDHKRIFDGDQGPNTGGMGAYVPTSLVDVTLAKRIDEEVLKPTLAGLKQSNIDYRGVLYVGLMIVKGKPYVLEYNVRFGDPECQALMLHLESDLYDLLFHTAAKTLAQAQPPKWYPGTSLCVVLASGGYPDQSLITDMPISGLNEFVPEPHAIIFHAGTKQHAEKIVNSGGRVLNVVTQAKTAALAAEHAYKLVEKIYWHGCHYRRDIGSREIERQQHKVP